MEILEDILSLFSDNKDALTAIGIILTFLVSAISLYFSVRNNRAVHYVNSITKSRIEWIQKVRTLVAEYLAMTRVESLIYNEGVIDSDIVNKANSIICEIKKLETEILLLLNTTDSLDKSIAASLKILLLYNENFYFNVSSMQRNVATIPNVMPELLSISNSIEKESKDLTKNVQIYLKSEWNRVKYESKGKNYQKEIQKFDLEELKEKYNNPDYVNKIWKRRFVVLWAKIRRIPPICFGVDFRNYIIGRKKRD